MLLPATVDLKYIGQGCNITKTTTKKDKMGSPGCEPLTLGVAMPLPLQSEIHNI